MLDAEMSGGSCGARQVNTDASAETYLHAAGWGAAVHGSSAFLESLGHQPPPASSAAVPHQSSTAQPQDKSHAYASSCPNLSGADAGSSQQHVPWAYADTSGGLVASTAHYYPPYHCPPQQPHQSALPNNSYQHAAHGYNQYSYPYPQQHYPQQLYPQPHHPYQGPYHHQYPQPYQQPQNLYPYPHHTQNQAWHDHYQGQQYAWRSFHGHSAVTATAGQEGGATATDGAAGSGSTVSAATNAVDVWAGWTSCSGTRPAQVPHSEPPSASVAAAAAASGAAAPVGASTAPGIEQHLPQQTRSQQLVHTQQRLKEEQQQAFGGWQGGAAGPQGSGLPGSSPAAVAVTAAAASSSVHIGNLSSHAMTDDGDKKPSLTEGVASLAMGAACSVADTSAKAGAAASAPSGSLAPEVADLVVVWDLDETLIVFNSLLSGAFARAAAAAHGRGPPDSNAAGAAAARVAPAASADASEAGPGAGGGSGGAGSGSGSETSRLPREALALGQRLADLVFDFCDNHLEFRTFDTLDPLSFADLWAQASTAAAQAQADGDADARMADGSGATFQRSTLERIARVYAGGSETLTDVMGHAGCRTLAEALAEAELMTGGWVAAAKRLLTGVSAAVAAEGESTSSAATLAAEAGPTAAPPPPAPPALAFRRVRHVLVSAGHLVATLGKLLLWGLDEHFDIRDVYSASGRTKLDAFRCLRGRFGPQAAFVAVGDGAEEERAAAAMGWGFVRVSLSPSAAARPVGAIPAGDVLSAARQAYFC